MKKIQQFFIYKFETQRLKETRYKVKNITPSDARMDGELISISNSEMVRTILRVVGRDFSQYHLDELIQLKNKISKRKNSVQVRKQVSEINRKIDEMLFIPELISVSYKDKRHFNNILANGGLYVNGVLYVPFMASAGMIRRDSSLYIDSRIKVEVDRILNNNRNREIEIVPAKFLAYFSLYSSSTIPVTFPRLAVVPDLLIHSVKKVDYSNYIGKGVDPVVEERELEIEFNAFDGEGLCSPDFARVIQKDLGLDYVPSVIGIRAPFMKGMCVVFDFKDFAQKIAGKDSFIDIYGETINVQDVDCIVSESQFKLWQSYSSTKEYIRSCVENKLDFGITKVNPKIEKNHAKTSYQFLQVLKLNDRQIDEICKPTVEWLEDISSLDVSKALLYLLGETDFSDGWFDRLDFVTQALLIENSLINDSYFTNHIHKSLAKKKNDAKFGRLYFNANYQVMISDPYAFCSHVFGLGLNPMLQEGEHYSHYWNTKSVQQVAAIRSPIVHESEVDILNFRSDANVNYWFSHIKSGVVFPASGVGIDAAILGGADYDLDLVCTINNTTFIEGRVHSLPVFYSTKKADKAKLDSNYEAKLYAAQSRQIGVNKIGFLTNISSTNYSLIYNFEEGSKEYEAISQRLKYGRVAQGNLIDAAKGIVTDPFPEHFAKWMKVTPDMTDEDRELREFYNSIVAERRPAFMRWLYPHYQRRYLKEIAFYDNISNTKWGIPFTKLLKMRNLNDEQKDLLEKYNRRTFFIDNNSTMNRISKHIEFKLKDMRTKINSNSRKFDYKILFSRNYKTPSRIILEKAKLLHKEWKSLNRNLRENNGEFENESHYISYDQINAYINNRAYQTISANSEELADIMITMCYSMGVQARAFVWKCFGKEVIRSLKEKRTDKFLRVPMLNEKGSLRYLWANYGIYLLNLEETK